MDLQQIDDLCDEFEAAWRRGESPRIEDFLERTDEEHRSKLLRELLEIELELSTLQAPESQASIAQAPILQLQDSLKSRFPEESEKIESVVRRVAQLRQIGDYEILEELGHGGMGVVYKARQKLLNQTVAIKVLTQTLLDDPQAIGRFRREMQLIGGLNHPNIVRALNAGTVHPNTVGGAHYLVMEFVDGITLQRLGDMIRKNRDQQAAGLSAEERADYAATVHHLPSAALASETPAFPFVGSSSRISNPPPSTAPEAPSLVFSVGAACEAIRQAALGLQHAHEFGLVHRDIKPANLMLDRYGTVKLLDLGLGKFLDDHRQPGDDASLTMVGTTIGTIDYISPEQCENAGDVDIRADLYSLGCTMYFLMSGKPPYSGSRYDTTRKKLMAHIVGEIPKLKKISPEVPDEVEAVLQKMLAKEPAERFQTPLEVAEALEPFASFDELRDMIDGAIPGGKKRAPGSTGRLSGTSNTKAVRKTKRRFWTPGNDAWLTALPFWLPIVVGLLIALSIPGIKSFRDTTRKAQQQHQTQSPDTSATAVELQAAKETAQTDLALLPGLNGAWWFDETPWYLPYVREMLVRKIDESNDVKTILGDDPERYYDPNVPAVQDWLWGLVQKDREGLSENERNLAEKLKAFYDSDLDVDGDRKSFREFLDAYVAGHGKGEPWRGVELHTRALLEHRLALIDNDKETAATAARRYDEALEQYRKEAREQSKEATFRSRRMEFLCMSDAARLEYLATGNYARAVKKFETITQSRETGERLGALFLSELRAAHGTLCAEAGQYNDSLFITGRDSLSRSKAGKRMHPLAAHLAERYAWSLLDQWKVVDAEKQFTDALIIREANRQESKNRFALISLLHDLHGLALTFRYKGTPDRAVEEYRRTLGGIDQALEECRGHPTSPELEPADCGLRRYHASLRDRAANTRERLADCTLYGGAASGAFGPGRLGEATKLYEEAARFYDLEGPRRTMLCKQAILFLLQGEIDKAERILCDLDERKRDLLGNHLRTELLRQVADALLEFRKNPKETADKRKQALRQFLQQFAIPGNPASSDATRRETLELRIFCAEFLIDEALDSGDLASIRRDLVFFMQPLGVFVDRPESRPFLRPITDQIVRANAMLCDAAPDSASKQSPLGSIVRVLQWMRVRTNMDPADASASDALPTLVVFSLTENPKDGIAVFYPQDSRPAELYRVPLTRQQVKSGMKKQDAKWTLDEKLVEAVRAERKAGRRVSISWNDEACWVRNEDALHDGDWPFDEFNLHADGVGDPPR